jgi:hypothetical protein
MRCLQPLKRALADGTGHAIWFTLLAKATALAGMWFQGSLAAVLLLPPTTLTAALTSNEFITLVDVGLLVTFFLPFYLPRNFLRVALVATLPALVLSICIDPALVSQVVPSIAVDAVNANVMRALTMLTLAVAVMANGE